MIPERIRSLFDAHPEPATLDDAYRAGYDCGISGPNNTNCHFRLFARPDLTAAWERGKAAAAAAPKTP